MSSDLEERVRRLEAFAAALTDAVVALPQDWFTPSNDAPKTQTEQKKASIQVPDGLADLARTRAGARVWTMRRV